MRIRRIADDGADQAEIPLDQQRRGACDELAAGGVVEAGPAHHGRRQSGEAVVLAGLNLVLAIDVIDENDMRLDRLARS